MIELRMSRAAELSFNEVLELFLEDQPTALIAEEMLVSFGVLQTMLPGTKFHRAFKAAEQAYGQSREFWQGTPDSLGTLIDLTRHAIRRAESEAEKRLILFRLITEASPDFVINANV